jgi:hypothetical protein
MAYQHPLPEKSKRKLFNHNPYLFLNEQPLSPAGGDSAAEFKSGDANGSMSAMQPISITNVTDIAICSREDLASCPVRI